MTKIFHKRVTSSSRCDTFEYQACDSKNINTNKMNAQEKDLWRVFDTKFRWSDVNCPACIALKDTKKKYQEGRRKAVNLYLGAN